MENKRKKERISTAFGYAFPHTIPVLTGFLMLGMAYGMLMKTAGYNALWSTATSMFAICGGMQMLAVSFFQPPFNPFAVYLLSVAVNARHSFYGLSLIEKYGNTGKLKPFLIFSLTDEAYSIVSTVSPPQEVSKRWFYFAVSFLIWVYWAVGTAMGGIMGEFVSFDTTGIDFVLTALFAVLLLEQLKDRKNIYSGVVGTLSSIVALLFFGGNNMVIPAMAIVFVVLYLGRNKVCR